MSSDLDLALFCLRERAEAVGALAWCAGPSGPAPEVTRLADGTIVSWPALGLKLIYRGGVLAAVHRDHEVVWRRDAPADVGHPLTREAERALGALLEALARELPPRAPSAAVARAVDAICGLAAAIEELHDTSGSETARARVVQVICDDGGAAREVVHRGRLVWRREWPSPADPRCAAAWQALTELLLKIWGTDGNSKD
jgi:hypothetical protein